MSRKRFTDADKWEDGWFCNQSCVVKLFWIYLCDRCDHAGVWEVNWKLASFHLGDIEPKAIEAALVGRIQPIKDGKCWFIPGFIRFQYPTGLSSDSPAHKRIRFTLTNHGLNPDTLSPTLPTRVSNTPEDKEVEEDKDSPRGSAEGGKAAERAAQQKEFSRLLVRLVVADGSAATRKWWALAQGNPLAKNFNQKCALVEWCVNQARACGANVQYASDCIGWVRGWQP